MISRLVLSGSRSLGRAAVWSMTVGGMLLGALVVPNCSNSDSSSDSIKCEHNSDCAHIEDGKPPLRCGFTELYCVEGECHAACAPSCRVIRDDINPCDGDRLCFSRGPIAFCTLMPITCAQDSDCPIYRPQLSDGGVGNWSCGDGVCEYPGWRYPTQ
jgi:hypothetical protein